MRQVLIFALLCGMAHAVCTSTCYYDPLYTGAGTQGTQADPFKTMATIWSTVNTNLATQDVTVFFTANGTNSGWAYTSRTDTSTHVLTFDGASQINSNHTTPSWSTNVTLAPCKYYDAGCAWAAASDFIVNGSNTPSGGSPSNCPGYVTMQGFEVQVTDGSFQPTYLHHLTVQYNKVHRVALGGNGPGVLVGPGNNGNCGASTGNHGVPGGPDNVTVQYNHFYDSWGEGLYIGASTSNPTGDGAPTEDSQYLTFGYTCLNDCNTGANYVILGNTIESCAVWSGQGDGIDIKDGHTNMQILRNTIRCAHAPISCGGSCTNTPGSDGQGIAAESGGLFDSNYVESPAHACYAIFASWNNGIVSRASSVWQNNMCINNTTNSGMRFFTPTACGALVNMPCGDPGAGTVPRYQVVKAYNNTAFNVISGSCITSDSGNIAGSMTVENNICHTTGGIGGGATLGTHDFNLVFNGGSCPVSGETHDVCTDPKFVSTSIPYADINFKLQGGSPAASAGADLSAIFTLDYFGTSRVVPFWIGAYQQSAVAPVLPAPAFSMFSLINPPEVP